MTLNPSVLPSICLSAPAVGQPLTWAVGTQWDPDPWGVLGDTCDTLVDKAELLTWRIQRMQ